MTKIDLEKIMLLIFFVAILFVGPGVLFDHKIQHDFPYAYGASDAFQHQIRAEAIKDAGHFRYEAAYIARGFENVVGKYPPVIYHLAVILSHAAGIEVYDSIYFVVVLFAIIAGFVMYFIVRNFNKTVALFSLPLSILIFSYPPLMGFMWGHWPSILAQSFLILFFWSVMKIDLDKSYLLIALSFSAAALTHIPAVVFGSFFLGLFFVIKLFARKISKKDIKTMVIVIAIFLMITFYYGVIFQNTWTKTQSYEFAVEPVWEGNPAFYIGGFGLLLIPLVIGIILSIPKLKGLHISFILAITMLIGGFLNYVGFGFRSFQARFFWPIYLSVFVGFGIYILFKFIIKRWNFIYTTAIFVILVVLLTGIIKFPVLKQTDYQTIPAIPHLNGKTSPGVMDPFHWESFNWLSGNTEPNATIYFFYGDIYSQDALLRNSKRVHYQVYVDDFVKSLQERKIKKEYVTESPADSSGTFAYRASFFKFIDPVIEQNLPPSYNQGPRNICNYNYYVFDKTSRQPVLAQYNLIIANDLIKKDFINPVFENQFVVILKNSNLGADCIEERSF